MSPFWTFCVRAPSGFENEQNIQGVIVFCAPWCPRPLCIVHPRSTLQGATAEGRKSPHAAHEPRVADPCPRCRSNHAPWILWVAASPTWILLYFGHWVAAFKGIVHPKMKIVIYSLSSSSKPVFISLFCQTQRKIFWRNFVNGLLSGTIDFHSRK